jgi:alpha-glucosidase
MTATAFRNGTIIAKGPLRSGISLLLIQGAVCTVAWAQPWTVSSPSGALTVTIKQDVIADLYPSQSNCYYQVSLNNAVVLDWSPLGIKTGSQSFISDLTFVSKTDSLVNEKYSLPSGKRSQYENKANQSRLAFKTASNGNVAIVFRVSDDAVAFRYELAGSGSATISAEQSGFRVPSGSTGWMQNWAGYYEATYDKGTVGTNFKTGEFAFPGLFKTPAGSWMLISESAVYGEYCGSHLNVLGNAANTFMVKFPQTSLSGTLPWNTPWRVAIVGTSLAALVESSVIDNLNPPSEVTDISWIKSGRAAWSWLSQGTGDLALQQKYVTFAKQMTWEYNLIDDGFDKTKMTQLTQTAKDNSVGQELWYNYSDLNTQAKQDAATTQWKTWGIKSLKIDFIGKDDQNIMAWYDMTARTLLKNEMLVTFHGSTIPRGQRRRWPNIMTYEGVRGDEYYGRGYPGPAHNCTLPFTRNVIGPMDATPVLFTTGKVTNGTPTERTSTDAHELALSVVFESGILHFADSPESYQASIGMGFLKTVPSAWDEIHFIDGVPGQSVVLARRKGNDWYLAGISAEAAKKVTVPLEFIKAGSYTVDLYKDSTGTARAMAKQTLTISSATPLQISLNANGGFVFKIPGSYDVTTSIRAIGSNGKSMTPSARKTAASDFGMKCAGPCISGHDVRGRAIRVPAENNGPRSKAEMVHEPR